jgi:hypothetical protein
MLVRLFQLLAVVLVGLAAWFFSRGQNEPAFVAAVLAACSYLLNLRFQIKRRIATRNEAERNAPLPDDEASG